MSSCLDLMPVLDTYFGKKKKKKGALVKIRLFVPLSL